MTRTGLAPFLGTLLLATGMGSFQAQAQSLDDQYQFYLAGKCDNLHFARDDNFVLLPGQAGPHLQAFCSGPIQVGGGGGSTSQGGGAAAEEISNAGGEEDKALQRRRGRLKSSDADQAATADSAPESQLASFGATSVFASFDYLHERQVTTEFEAGRHASGFGGLLGIDHRFGSKVLAGLAFHYAEQTGTLDSGGDFATHTPGIRLYGSWLPMDGLFVDGAVGLDHRGVDTHRIVTLKVVTFGSPRSPPNISFNPPPAPANSATHESDVSGELHVGYDFSLSSLTIGPRAALTLAHSSLDAYVENGDTPMTLAINAQRRTSLRSLIGFQATNAINMGAGVLIPQIEAEWVHEYLDDQRVLSARFAEDLRAEPVEFHFLTNPPDRNWFTLRFAVVTVFPHGFSSFAAVERTLGNLYVERYQATLGLRLEL